ncbi:MAG TPA: UDP-N-acetylmuramoyl-L-alanine--D-glutamate ligase [Burkholderiaceae bacterium]
MNALEIEDLHLILKSPGLAPHDARIAGLLSRARTAEIRVQGELDLFAAALAELKAERRYAPAVLAITGTNGKTTVTSLTGLLVERCGKRVAVAGNIGTPMLTLLAAALELEPLQEVAAAEVAEEGVEVVEETLLEEVNALLEDAPLPIKPPPPKGPVFEHLPEVWVLELSSFQLDGGGSGVMGFEPTAATVLNITQDHLDWHGDMAAYTRAKARIFGSDALMVINRDDAAVEALVPAAVPVKQRGKATKMQGRNVLRFGLNAPQAPGDYGLVNEGGMAWLVRALDSDPTLKRRPGEAEEVILQRLMPADALRIRGRHNASNALAALALAGAAGCPLATMLHGLREYEGEPHRVQHVGTIKRVDFYDDSKGTNVGATVAALTGLGMDRAPAKLVVILGGDGKGQDFSPLREPLARHARAVALIGRDAEAIRAVLPALPVELHTTLEAATQWAYAQAQPGDSVLLSPACASLDMFSNYAHRAEVFVATVQGMASDRGEIL